MIDLGQFVALAILIGIPVIIWAGAAKQATIRRRWRKKDW